ncbi:MAG: hypothetical protein QM783_06910 [Phycisphaerales bacterium]
MKKRGQREKAARVITARAMSDMLEAWAWIETTTLSGGVGSTLREKATFLMSAGESSVGAWALLASALAEWHCKQLAAMISRGEAAPRSGLS